MAPADDAEDSQQVEEAEDNSRFIEEDADPGPHTYVVDCPAVFLTPDWSSPGEVADVTDVGDAFDVPAVSKAFTLCACIKRPGGVEGGRILSKGELPDGWLFTAGATVSFAVAPLPEPVEAADGGEAEPGEESTQPASAEPASGPPGRVVGGMAVDDGEWHHVAAVFAESGLVSLFVDGRADGEAALEVHAAPGQPLLLGVAESEVEAGAGVKDVQAYAYALTREQIHGLATGSKDLGTGISLSLMPEQVAEYRSLKAGGEGEGEGDGLQAARALLTSAGLGDRLGRAFQQEVVLDLFDDLLTYAESICLTARKTAVMVRILQEILEMMHRKSKSPKRLGETSSIYECFQEFKRLLLAHSFAAATTARKMIDRDEVRAGSALALGVFTLSEIRLLTEFLTGALFQQFLLYQCVLVAPQDQVTIMKEAIVSPPAPPDPHAQKHAKLVDEQGIKDSGALRNSLPLQSEAQPEADAEAPEQGAFLDQTLSQLPQDLSVDAHHEEATKAAEATADTFIKRHDEVLSPK